MLKYIAEWLMVATFGLVGLGAATATFHILNKYIETQDFVYAIFSGFIGAIALMCVAIALRTVPELEKPRG